MKLALNLPWPPDRPDSLRPNTIVTITSPRLEISLGPLELYRRIASPHSLFIRGLHCGDDICTLVGWNPVLRFQAKGRRASVDAPDGFRQAIAALETSDDPLQVLRILLAPERYQFADSPLFAAVYGVVSYDAGWEMIPDLPQRSTPETELPDWHLVVPSMMVLYHPDGDATLAVNLDSGAAPDAHDLSRIAQSRLLKAQELATAPKPPTSEPEAPKQAPLQGACWLSDQEFVSAVQRIQHAIRGGEVSKATPSLRVDVPFVGNPTDVLERLLRINPSRCNYLLRLGESTLIGASPEVLVEKRGRQVQMRPLAGTRKRGPTDEQETELLADLESNPKDQLEHRISVAVAAADLGSVTATGTLSLTEMEVDKYSHVMHLATLIKAEMSPHCDSLDLLKAVFPAGTVTGAPRHRAIQLIDEVEPFGRGLYAGAVVCLQLNGDLQTFITLRSIVIHQGVASAQAGAGVVADSDAEAEYEECLAKIQTALLALGEVELQ
ncbi:anthranilate synthase component I family protein [Myxococcota bacterium]